MPDFACQQVFTLAFTYSLRWHIFTLLNIHSASRLYIFTKNHIFILHHATARLDPPVAINLHPIFYQFVILEAFDWMATTSLDIKH